MLPDGDVGAGVFLSLQYKTSKEGSTMGITVSHAAMLAHCHALTQACGYTEGEELQRLSRAVGAWVTGVLTRGKRASERMSCRGCERHAEQIAPAPVPSQINSPLPVPPLSRCHGTGAIVTALICARDLVLTQVFIGARVTACAQQRGE